MLAVELKLAGAQPLDTEGAVCRLLKLLPGVRQGGSTLIWNIEYAHY